MKKEHRWQLKAALPAGLPVGKVSAGIDLNTAQLESTTYQEMVDKARGFQESGGTVTSNGSSSGSSEKTSDTKMFSDNESSQKAKTALEAYQLAEAKSMALGNSMSNIDSKTDTLQLDNATADKMFTWGHYDAWYDKLSASDKERLGSPTEYHDSSSAFKTARNIEETLKGGDKNLGLDAQDKGIAAGLMRSIGNSIGDVDRATGFMVAANTYDKLANDVKQIDNANYGLSEDKSQQIQNNAQGAIMAAQSAELDDNTDNIALKNQKDAQGFVGPNAEQIQAQRDLMDNSISTEMLEKGQSLTAFLDKNHGWDDGNIPHSTNEHAVNNGTNLPSIYHGMDALINSDYKGMSSQDRTDALVAEKYLKDNPELYNGIGETQKDHMAKNMAYLAVNATDEERSHANGIYNGSQSRSDGIMAGVDDSFSAYAISDPYAKRVADQVTAINLANTDSTNPDLNYNGSANGGSLTDAANLAAKLSNPSTTPEEAYDLGRGGDSPFAMLAGVLSLSSDNELALGGAKYGDVFSSAAQDPHTIANVEAMRQGTQDGNIISPDPVYSSVQDDGSLGQSFSAGGETYTLSNDGNANSNYNTYTDSQGISYTQPSGSDFIARTGTENSAYNTVADNNNEATTSFLSPIVGSTIASAAGHVVEDATNFAAVFSALTVAIPVMHHWETTAQIVAKQYRLII
ncbi:hypothetical protein L3081_24770 [Colwellia sp. MSW7]|uniref:Uncharacterized protein n=1 Tax=Colwellia maritima TaxID=2912588 RepID=A0ABS9X735_9GAMM|nr:hypothetical protein [Colwellia maritima]MCI2286039.1 hypothetical protein [Colwellia maritima]